MNLDPRIEVIASALGERSRANIVCALMDGRAFTAKELAYQAGVSAQTASFHLQHLVDCGLLSRTSQGRNRYYYLAGPEVAEAVESLMTLAPRDHLKRHKTRAADELLLARSCYDHIAGRLGILLAERLAEIGAVLSRGGAFTLTPQGRHLFLQIGLDLETLERGKRPLVRHCLDWTERRFHFGGGLAAALMTHLLDDGWLVRQDTHRALRITPKGRELLVSRFGLAPDSLEPRTLADEQTAQPSASARSRA